MQEKEEDKAKIVRLTSAPVGRLLTAPSFLEVVRTPDEEKKEKERLIEEKKEQAKEKKAQSEKKKEEHERLKEQNQRDKEEKKNQKEKEDRQKEIIHTKKKEEAQKKKEEEQKEKADRREEKKKAQAERKKKSPCCGVKGDKKSFWLGCDGSECQNGGWVHGVCVGLSDAPVGEQYFCPLCVEAAGV